MNNVYIFFGILAGFWIGKAMRFSLKTIYKTLLEEEVRVKWPLEIIIALFFGLTIYFFPLNIFLFFHLAICCFLMGCFITDYEYGILPDEFTLSLMWVGLVGSLFPLLPDPKEAILGAVVGYVFFWIFNLIYRYFRGVDGMYPGDFKLNAGIGACVGLKILFPILFASLVLSLIVTGVRFLLRKGSKTSFLNQEIPYGCYASLVTMIALFI